MKASFTELNGISMTMVTARHMNTSLNRLLSKSVNFFFGIIYDTTKFRNEGDNIYAFKPQPDRYLCFFFTGRKIVVTNAYHKKSDKLPPSEKSTALKNMAAYKKAVDEKNKNEKEE